MAPSSPLPAPSWAKADWQVLDTWPCPLPAGGHCEEYAVAFDRGRHHRILMLPALFDEGNKTRRLIVEAMRRLDRAGIDTILPDLPGLNESTVPLRDVTLAVWRDAAEAAAGHFAVTHQLTVRASAILAVPAYRGWRYAPTGGPNALRALLRSRQVASREAGRDERVEDLLEEGRRHGLELAGYTIGPQLFAELEMAKASPEPLLLDIEQQTIGRGGLWLRAEPDFDAGQAEALAAVVAVGITA